MNPKDLAEYAISKFPEHITLGEFKYMDIDQQSFTTQNTEVNTFDNSKSKGFGIRVLLDGAWGFFSSNILEKTEVDEVIKRALKLAKAASLRNPGIKLSDDPVVEAKVANEIKIDPFDIPVADKLEYFKAAINEAKEYPEIKFANTVYLAQKENMVFYNTEGSKIEQTIIMNGGYINLLASGNSDTQERKFIDDQFQTKGWEHMLGMDLPAVIKPAAKELVDILDAPQMKPGTATIILNPSQLGIQLHESTGHPTELDRVLGYEAAYAGTSFLKTKLYEEQFQYGNELVTIHADATIPGALGTFPYDHEGVAGKKTTLVDKGKFVGYLSSRETAPLLGLTESGGTMRSSGYDKIPLVRMTNIVLEADPQGYNLEEMIAETKEGYYFNTNRSWSIDDIRLNFQFGSEMGYRIEKGEITGLVKNPTYTGITPEFWSNVSAVGRDFEVLGTPFCGKGEPGQGMYTGHGGPHTRFDNIRVGLMN